MYASAAAAFDVSPALAIGLLVATICGPEVAA